MVTRTSQWISIGGSFDPELEKCIEQAASERMSETGYTSEDAKYVAAIDLALASGKLRVSNEVLEKLRRLCQLWDVDLRIQPISSHRKFVGPIIVAVKKLLFPIIKLFMKDYLRQQRTFNAAAIALLAEIGNLEASKTVEDDA